MMLSHRSYQKELLDEDSIPFADIQQNMKELDFINKWLGGHAITIHAFHRLAAAQKELSVCEIGCGGGDNLRAVNDWCRKKNIKLDVIGIDIKKECINFAKNTKSEFSSVNWIVSDYSLVSFSEKPDIIFSSLFCHHFTEKQLVFQLAWMKENSRIGFFINDLHRNVIAYYSIQFLTAIFSKSYLVKNDAPISVSRGFRLNEWKELCAKAKTENAVIEWKWAFRYLVLFKH